MRERERENASRGERVTWHAHSSSREEEQEENWASLWLPLVQADRMKLNDDRHHHMITMMRRSMALAMANTVVSSLSLLFAFRSSLSMLPLFSLPLLSASLLLSLALSQAIWLLQVTAADSALDPLLFSLASKVRKIPHTGTSYPHHMTGIRLTMDPPLSLSLALLLPPVRWMQERIIHTRQARERERERVKENEDETDAEKERTFVEF